MTENLLISLKPVKLINSVNFTGKCRMLRKVNNITFFILSENQEMHWGGGGRRYNFGPQKTLSVIESDILQIKMDSYW